MWFVRRSSQVPNLMHTCIHWIYNFSHNTARFYVVAMPRTLNWEKKAGEKEQSLFSCFKSAKYTCLRCQGYFCILCSVFENDERSKCQAAGKQAVQSHIVSHVSEKLWRSKKRSNVINDSNEFGKKRDLQKQEEWCSTKWKLIMAWKYGIEPRLFSFSVHEIKVRIDTRYAVWISCRANVALKSDLIQLASAHN